LNASQLLEVATKVFINRDQKAQKESRTKDEKESISPRSGIKWTGRAVPVRVEAEEEAKGGALGNSPQVWPQRSEPLKKIQCSFCCQEGHWRNECPQLQVKCRMTKEKEDFMGLGSIERVED
jgi:hypothetical protein